MTQRQKILLYVSLPVVLFFVALLIFFRGSLSMENYHVDEGNWISVGNIYFSHFFVERDFRHSDWQKGFNTWGAYQPQIAKYIIGAFLHLRGFGEERDYFFDFSHSIDWNREQGNVPPWEIIWAARFPIALLGAGLCILLFPFAARLAGTITCGVIAFLLAIGNPLIRSLSEICLIDIPAEFFFVLTLLALLSFFGTKKWQSSIPQAILWSFAIGVSAGCAIGTKLSNLLILAFIALFFAYMISQIRAESTASEEDMANKLKNRKILLIVLCAILLITTLVFYASNPFLYEDPIGGMHHLYRLRNIVSWYQKVDPEAALASPVKQIGFVLYRSFWTYGTLRAFFHLPLDAIFFLLGLIRLLKGRKMGSSKQRLYIDAAILWFAIVWLGTTVWIPLDWDRYYLPVVPSIIVIESVGIVAILHMIKCTTRLYKER
jgi:dolichyl-phosphate-mannose--protein O-mannosyl transferase